MLIKSIDSSKNNFFRIKNLKSKSSHFKKEIIKKIKLKLSSLENYELSVKKIVDVRLGKSNTLRLIILETE